MSEKHHILAVDDEPINLDILKELLEETYDLSYATTGEECIALASQTTFDLVLLDVGLPGISGLDACRQLKADPSTQDLPIIFVSALTSTKERLNGFNAGAQDYINKPFNQEELKAKIQLLVDIRSKVLDLNKNVQYATGTAMAAMSSAGELGVVLHFLRESFLCKTLTSLTGKALEALEQYGLSSTIQLRTQKKNLTIGHDKQVPDIEHELFELVASSDCRIHSFGTRSIFNFNPVIILVKNMPMDDEALQGRHRDNIAILAEGIQARLEALLLQIEVDHKKTLLWQVIEQTESALKKVTQHHEKQQQTQSELMDGLSETMEASFQNLVNQNIHLSGEEEEQLLEAAKTILEPTTALYESSLGLGDEINAIMLDVRKALGDSNR